MSMPVSKLKKTNHELFFFLEGPVGLEPTTLCLSKSFALYYGEEAATTSMHNTTALRATDARFILSTYDRRQ